jgi:hypothetical protein
MGESREVLMATDDYADVLSYSMMAMQKEMYNSLLYNSLFSNSATTKSDEPLTLQDTIDAEVARIGAL